MNPERVVDYLIIGGGVAGTTAAETIRREDSAGSVAIVSDEPHRFYSRIMLSKPNFFLGKIPFDQVWLRPESWYGEQRVELVAGRKAVALNPVEKVITLDDGSAVRYGKLLLAIGGCARPWEVPGAEKRGVFSLRTLGDARAIIAAVKSAKRALAVGGGFVSFEMCEMMHMAGLEVSLAIREPFYWGLLWDEASGRMVEQALKRGGVKIFRNAEVREVVGTDAVAGVILKDGTSVPCGMIIVGIGTLCPFGWLAAAGVVVNRGILANEYLETNLPDIWAAGDAAEFNDLVLGEQVQLGNWANAQAQGKTAGFGMAGKREPFRLASFYTTSGFGITIAFVGDVRMGQDREVIPRGSPEANSYARLIVKGNELVGATLINRTQELGLITKIIERDVDVSRKRAELTDPVFDLKTLAP